MSINERCNASVRAVLVYRTGFTVSQGQPVDNRRNPRGSSNFSAPNPIHSNSYMSTLSSPVAPRNNSKPSSSTTTTSSSITTNTHIQANFDKTILNEQYVAFRVVLNTGDPKNKQQLNKSHDKLLRLTPAQLYELSTNVFDELMRRQAPTSPNGPPAFLLPDNTLSNTGNQARQKLPAVSPSRFQDLMADVSCEIRRRFPQFERAYLQRTGNRTSTQGDLVNPRSSTPFNGVGPRRESRMIEYPKAAPIADPRHADIYGFPASPSAPSFPRKAVTNGEYSPTPEQPNRDNANVPKAPFKAEECDEGDNESYGFSLDQAPSSCESTRSAGSGVTTTAHNKFIEKCKGQLRQLSDKLRSIEDAMSNKEEISGILGDEHSRATAHNLEKQEGHDVRLDLENKLAEAQALSGSMKQELQRMREDQDAETERLREEVASARMEAQEVQQVGAKHAAAQQTPRGIEPVELDNGRIHYSPLEQQRAQRHAMEEVQKEIKEFLREVRALSEKSSSVYERQGEEIGQTAKRFEQEVREWMVRYVGAKEQLRSTCASPGSEHEAVKLDHGLIKNIHVTEFQATIDDILHKARTDDSESIIDGVKSVVVSVCHITHNVKVPRNDSENSARQQMKLRAEVSSATNRLIRVSMIYVASAGLYPLSLLDAAASRLAGAIVGFLQLDKIQTLKRSAEEAS